ncbi:hypothetical protein NL676_010894 [Syzygium grande]|nr:hypothetical protein NL676_010894 [Syzygium grande]
MWNRTLPMELCAQIRIEQSSMVRISEFLKIRQPQKAESAGTESQYQVAQHQAHQRGRRIGLSAGWNENA